MKIYTKKGDTGTTALYGGLRLSKADLRIEAYGNVDELNSFIGLAATYMEEKEYRLLVDQTFRTIEKAFDQVDPDEAEFELAQGAATIRFSNGTKCILSQQPSVRQVWMAVAAKGVAYHFNFDSNTKQWKDDKGKGVELLSCVRGVVRESSGVELKL